MEIVVALLVGFIIGMALSWYIAKSKFVSEKGISHEEIDRKYVIKELYSNSEQEISNAKRQLQEKNELIISLNKEIAANKQIIENMGERLENHKTEVEDLQKRMTSEFENIATRILENRSQQFIETSKNNISSILNPLKEKIGDFRSRVDEIYNKDTEERTGLKTELKNLINLNKQLSNDANNLANALKGESKKRGGWGEAQLQVILERVGLIKGVHFRMQESFVSEGGERLQPDCIINLPDDKHLILDSKVSLVAFERYFNAENEEDKREYANQHLSSISGHIRDLSKKNYQTLYQINSPDYVLMFIPYESALELALKENPGIWQQAMDKNIAMVTGFTLLVTLKTIAYIWKQENQKKYVLEIAKQGGALYDKFVSFIEDLKRIGTNLDQSKFAYDAAMNKLVLSSKKGDTLVGRAEKMRKLGSKVSKLLPQDIVNKVEINNVDVESPEALTEE